MNGRYRSTCLGAAIALAACCTQAVAQMRTTELMYSGGGGEFVEFTNVGGAAIDMTGWSFDDEEGIAGTQDLSAFGIVMPGESVILTEDDEATFVADWGLVGVAVIGNSVDVGLSRGDTAHLFDASATLADVFHYGDQTFAGTPRPQDSSIWPCQEAIGADNVYQWNMATAGDAAGSYVSAQSDVGNPGTAVTISCGAPADGACCSAGNCTVLLQAHCIIAQGVYQGDGTNCTPNNCPAPASADIRITEWMYQGSGEEFLELTNLGADPVDMTGWSMDDDSATPGIADLTALGTVLPGESVVVTDDDPLSFAAKWGLSGVTIINKPNPGLGRNDQINIYDASNTLVDVLTYGDQNFPGSIRTAGISGWPCQGVVGADDVNGWLFSSVDDVQNSVASTDGDVGSPGNYVADDCSAVATGACCETGVCTDETATDCIQGGRQYQGDPTDCGSFTCPAPTGGEIRITEYLYTGEGAEFVEFTNLDITPIDMTGWSFDDDSGVAGSVDLSGFGIVMPGQSVVLTDAADAATFVTDWNLSGVVVIAGSSEGLGRNDQINLYDSSGVPVDRLTYGDQVFAGTHRANGLSAWGCQSAIGADNVYGWPGSEAGDVQNSYFSADGDLGSPGAHVVFDCVGGCCNMGGTCSDGQFAECSLAGGEYAGHGTVCAGSTDGDTVDDLCDNCPSAANESQSDCNDDGQGDACDPEPDDQDTDGDGVCNGADVCPFDNPDDSDGDGVCDSDDGCPNDPNKIAPGACGCGVPDTDSDGDGTANCIDGCPGDPNKVAPGACGCGTPDDDNDGDGVADCDDVCPGVSDAEFGPECVGAIPTVSEWGLVVLALLLLTAAKVYFGRTRTVTG